MSDPNVIQLSALTGPPFVVILLNWTLFGALSIQTYLYFQVFPNDRTPLKALVYFVYLLESTQTFLLVGSAWTMFVSGFGDMETMDEIGTAWLSVCLIGGIGLIVQWFYSYRIAIISRNKIIPGFIVLMSLTSFTGALATTVIGKQAGKFSYFVRAINRSRSFPAMALWVGTGSVCDLVIATSMVYYLGRYTRYGTFSQSQAILSKLVRMTVETGMVTASISTLTLVLYYAPPLADSSYFLVPLSLQAKLYSMTMMAVLNSRMKLGVRSDSTTWRDNELAFAAPDSQDATTNKSNNSSSGLSPRTNIFVIKEDVTIANGVQRTNRLSFPQP